MVVIYYIQLFRTGADKHNDILMSLFLLVAETMSEWDLARKIIRSEVMFPLKKMKIFKMEKKNEEEKNDLFLLIMQLIFPCQKLQS